MFLAPFGLREQSCDTAKGEIVSLLVRRGASIDELDNEGIAARQFLAQRDEQWTGFFDRGMETTPPEIAADASRGKPDTQEHSGSESASEPPRLDRERSAGTVMAFLREHGHAYLQTIDESTLQEYVRASAGLSPNLYETLEAALLVLESAANRMQQDTGFWRFFVKYLGRYQCWHVMSSHEDAETKYRKHAIIWKVGTRFAVATSDNLYAFNWNTG